MPHFLGVLSRISDKHPWPFYIGDPSPPGGGGGAVSNKRQNVLQCECSELGSFDGLPYIELSMVTIIRVKGKVASKTVLVHDSNLLGLCYRYP